MSPPIDAAVVRHVAHLARLRLGDDEVARYTEQLGAILAYVRQLDALDTADVEPTAHALPVHNVFRPDVPAPPLGADRVLANAPAHADGYFVLPKVLDDEPGVPDDEPPGSPRRSHQKAP